MFYEWKEEKEEILPDSVFRFMDMHSGGRLKTDYENIYIEAKTELEAIHIFQKIFNRNPNNITCTCCGEDFSITKADTLEKASAFDRNCKYVLDEEGDKTSWKYLEEAAYDDTPHISLEEYCKQKNVLIVPRNKKE